MHSPKTLARIAGSLYLIMFVGAVFAGSVVRTRIVLPGDAAATADNIRASATLFRVGFVIDLVQVASFRPRTCSPTPPALLKGPARGE